MFNGSLHIFKREKINYVNSLAKQCATDGFMIIIFGLFSILSNDLNSNNVSVRVYACKLGRLAEC